MTLKYYKSLAKNNFGIGNLPWKVYLTPLCHQNPSLSDSKRERQINSLKFPLANTFVSSPFKFTQSNTNVCITWHRFRSWPPSVAFLFDKKKKLIIKQKNEIRNHTTHLRPLASAFAIFVWVIFAIRLQRQWLNKSELNERKYPTSQSS